MLELLIKASAGSDVTKTDETGYTPLHAVFQSGGALDQKEKVEFLLANGANINAVTSNGSTPLMMAVGLINANLEAVQALLSGRPTINAVNVQGQSALMIAAANTRNPAIISLLLNAGANAKIEDNTGRTALDWFDRNRWINWSPVRKELKDAM
jgi:ankyrin repeat protein